MWEMTETAPDNRRDAIYDGKFLRHWSSDCPPRRVVTSALTLMLAAFSLGAHERDAQQGGWIRTGQTPIAFSNVTLYSAGSFHHADHCALGKAKSDASGYFTIYFQQPLDSDAVLYLIADGGSVMTGPHHESPLPRGVRLATVIGPASVPGGVVINERTTTASAYAMAQFLEGSRIAGKAPGLQNAAATLRNLVNLSSGQVGSVLGNPPNGTTTSTMREFNSLANLLASCVNATTPAPCVALFDMATPPGGNAPRDTLQAAVNIAHYPWQNATALFSQSQLSTLYEPALQAAPDAWTLAIRYNGNGHEFDGPGNVAFDEAGNVWATNDYIYNGDNLQPSCAGDTLSKLTPTGEDAPGAPYSGGGLNGAGFGITIDPFGDVWVGNFGFAGKGCTDPPPPSNSASQFHADGTAVSPETGYTQGPISFPQGTVSDQKGNIWFASCGSASVTEFQKGNPNDSKNFKDIGLDTPFAVAIDNEGNAWVTGNNNNTVVALAPDGTPLPGSPFTGGGITRPMGVAVDSLDNVWISNSGVVQMALVCGGSGPFTPGGSASVTQIRRNGQPLRSFTGGGQTVPWGIAVDGDDNVWVANFGGQRLTELCGSRPSKCPPGHNTGDPISPDTGYSSDALTRNTAVAIDPSGNVWVANNWLNVPVQTNPGGHELVVFVGLAAPVKTPSIGPPKQP